MVAVADLLIRLVKKPCHKGQDQDVIRVHNRLEFLGMRNSYNFCVKDPIGTVYDY